MSDFLLAASTAFGLIAPAELGDKTQRVVAGLASTQAVLPIQTGGTPSLAGISAPGVLAGRTMRRRPCLPRPVSGMLFLLSIGDAGPLASRRCPG